MNTLCFEIEVPVEIAESDHPHAKVYRGRTLYTVKATPKAHETHVVLEKVCGIGAELFDTTISIQQWISKHVPSISKNALVFHNQKIVEVDYEYLASLGEPL